MRRILAFFFLLPLMTLGATPKWIWSSTNNVFDGKQVRYFRKAFVQKKPFSQAILTVSGDDRAEVYLNGKKVAATDDWSKPDSEDVSADLINGRNVLAARCENAVSYAGLIIRLQITTPTLGTDHTVYKPAAHAGLRWIDDIVTDDSWVASDQDSSNWFKPQFDDAAWKPAVAVASLGDKPWGDVFVTRKATPASAIQTEPGFKIELLHSALPSEGSWISMTMDEKGRLLISPQSEGKLLRITLRKGQVEKIERLDARVTSAMGLLYLRHHLYADAIGPKGWGIYRLAESNNAFAPPELLRKMDNGGEHGSHALVYGPDHKLYVVCGNFNKLPADILPNSPHRNYEDDQLLPRAEDGRGFGAGLKPPGGTVLRMDLDGKNCQVFAGGTRNTYCVAFSPEGELFGFDSDMEWDWGADWYRPIRINHWVSAGDYGFREGSGKFPEYYEDTLPAVLNVGIGSPTGVVFGTKAHFPKWYRQAFFMEDWSYGRLFAVHFTPDGASYDATIETVFRGIPLNLTALQIGRDGALYLITGGRNTESGLYRLTYDGPDIPMPPRDEEAERAGREARRLRHRLESFHGQVDPRIVGEAWPSLSSDDRWIRYAARIAVEWQPVSTWENRALSETNPLAGLTALLALARCGPPSIQPGLLDAVNKFPLDLLDAEEKLLKLRVLEVSFARQGRPAPALCQRAIAELDPLYPAETEPLNHELCELLLYLRAPDATAKTIALLDSVPTQEDQTYYVMRLRTITNGWTTALRKDYLAWFNKNRDHIAHRAGILQYFKDAGRDYGDGASLPPFLENFRNEFITNLAPSERVTLAAYLPRETNNAPVAPARKFVKNWTMQDLIPDLPLVGYGRSYNDGKKLFTAAQCVLCHRFGNAGGSIGPDLTAVASRLTSHDILESIILPSAVVSEQYQNARITLKDGDDYVGRVVDENDQKLTLMTDPIKLTKIELRKSDIQSRRASKLSPMPEGLVNTLSKNEILDLIAYLQSGGKKDYAAFKK